MNNNNGVIELLSDSSEEEAAAPADNEEQAEERNLFLDAEVRHVVIMMGAPKAMPRPEFMAWMRGGRMIRRVVNNAQPIQTTFRDQFIQTIKTEYHLETLPLPIYPHQPMELEMTFYRKVPVSMFRNEDREQGLKQPNLLHTTPLDVHTPDLDNLAKFVMDALNGVIYTDDRQVVRLILRKTYHMEPPFTGKTRVSFKMSPPNYVF